MLQALASVIGEQGYAGSADPTLGSSVSAAQAFSQAGLSLSNSKKDFGVSLSDTDYFFTAIRGASDRGLAYKFPQHLPAMSSAAISHPADVAHEYSEAFCRSRNHLP